MILKPSEERRLLGPRQPLLVQPIVISPYVGIDQRTSRIKLRLGRASRKEFIHWPLSLPRCETNQQCERLCASGSFASRPLREGSAEDLGARAFCQQLDLKTVQHCVSGFAQAEIGGTDLS